AGERPAGRVSTAATTRAAAAARPASVRSEGACPRATDCFRSQGARAPAMKRFKAAVIGGTGYGGAEMIRRLLIHPDVELVRVVAIDHVGEPLGAVHPPLTGRSTLHF